MGENSCGLFHPMQGHVQQQWGDHSPLGSSLLGWSESTFIDHPCLQPPFDEPLRRETAALCVNLM
jgi:hypothetical protein